MRRALVFIAILTLVPSATGCCFSGFPTRGGGGGGAGGGTTGTPTTIAHSVGTVTLGPGFLPDPTTFTGTAGGPIDATTMGAGCRGHIASAPNHVLNATGAFANLRIVVSSPVDTTLVVQHADGSFVCVDDAEGLNPIVQGPFGPGEHRIWVGAFSASGIGQPYTIGFTQLMTVTAASLSGGGPTGGGAGVAGWVPQDCGQTVPNYGSISVGSSVVLGMHTPWSGPDGRGGMRVADTNWADEMGRWVGQRTIVTELAGIDDAGCPVVRVSADGGRYVWRIRNLTL